MRAMWTAPEYLSGGEDGGRHAVGSDWKWCCDYYKPGIEKQNPHVVIRDIDVPEAKNHNITMAWCKNNYNPAIAIFMEMLEKKLTKFYKNLIRYTILRDLRQNLKNSTEIKNIIMKRTAIFNNKNGLTKTAILEKMLKSGKCRKKLQS